MKSVRHFKDISIFGKELPDVKLGLVDWKIDVIEKDTAVYMDIIVRKIQINFENDRELIITDECDIDVEVAGTAEDMFAYGLYVDDIMIEFDENSISEVKVIFGR